MFEAVFKNILFIRQRPALYSQGETYDGPQVAEKPVHMRPERKPVSGIELRVTSLVLKENSLEFQHDFIKEDN